MFIILLLSIPMTLFFLFLDNLNYIDLNANANIASNLFSSVAIFFIIFLRSLIMNFSVSTILIWIIYLLFLVGHLLIGFSLYNRNIFLNRLTLKVSWIILILSPLIFIFYLILLGISIFLLFFLNISTEDVISAIILTAFVVFIAISNFLPFYYFYKKINIINP